MSIRSNVIQWERRAGDRTQCERKKGAFIIIAADAIGPENVATCAAVDDRPFTIAANFDPDRFHGRLTRARTIPSLFIKMPRPETARTVIAMIGTKRFCGNVKVAGDTSERTVVAGFGLLICHVST